MAFIETILAVFGISVGSEYQKTVKTEEIESSKVNTVSLTDGVIVTVGDQAVYQTCVGWTDSNNKPKTTTGYVKKEDFDALNVKTVSIPANFAGLEAEMVPARLSYQLFRITEVVENEDYVEVTARHVWYDNLKNYTLWEADKETNYSAGSVCRNILTNTISPTSSRVATDCTDTKLGKEFDYKNKNLVEAFLDPENGVCAKFGLNLIRYNWDFYCLKNVGYNRGFIVENGKNLLGVERTESIENLVTRCAPIAKDSSGNIVWLDNNGVKYVDSQYISDYSCPHVEIYDTGLKIGDGDVTLDNIQAKLLEAGRNRFTNDKVDLPEVEMTIEFLSLGDTEEYSQYRGLDKVYLYDIITIHDTVRGYDYTAQVVGIEHDILTGMLLSVTIGSLNNWDGTRKIATWQVPEIDGTNIRLLSIQAGAFAAGAINEHDIANGVISYLHLAQATIDQLEANSITAVSAQIETIIAGHIDANSIKTTAISAINAKLGTAHITNGYIDNANITYLNVKAATAESLIAHDAVTDRYFIDKLAVRSAQMVYATVGELVIKASNGKYYRLDVAANGSVSPTEVTLTSAEVAAGVTSDGHGAIIETDLTVSDLYASNVKAINALIDQITADRIDVDELFARQAVIDKLETIDISSNTSLQLMVKSRAKVYRQLETPTDASDGDLWYKMSLQPSGEMQSQSVGELGNSPMWSFDGYELYRMEDSVWKQLDDTSEIRSTMAAITLDNESIELAIYDLSDEVDGKYTKMSGIDILAPGIEISGGAYVKIKTGGKFLVDSGNFSIDTSGNVALTGNITAQSGYIGGYSIGATRLSSGSGNNFVGLDSGTASFDYAIWAGGATASSAPFRLKRDGTLVVTKLEILDNQATPQPETINLRDYALWKLGYHPVKSVSSSGGYCTSMEIEGLGTVNFKSAASVYVEAARVASAPADYTATWTVEIDLSNDTSMTVALSDTYTPLRALYNAGVSYADGRYTHLGTRELGYMDHGSFESVGSHDWYYK